jgi:hypothetical protein
MLKIILICSLVLGLLAFVLIMFTQKRNSYQKILRLVYVLLLTYYSGLTYVIKSGLITEYQTYGIQESHKILCICLYCFYTQYFSVPQSAK